MVPLLFHTCLHDSWFETVTKQHTVNPHAHTCCQVLAECFSLGVLQVGFLQLCTLSAYTLSLSLDHSIWLSWSLVTLGQATDLATANDQDAQDEKKCRYGQSSPAQGLIIIAEVFVPLRIPGIGPFFGGFLTSGWGGCRWKGCELCLWFCCVYVTGSCWSLNFWCGVAIDWVGGVYVLACGLLSRGSFRGGVSNSGASHSFSGCCCWVHLICGGGYLSRWHF